MGGGSSSTPYAPAAAQPPPPPLAGATSTKAGGGAKRTSALAAPCAGPAPAKRKLRLLAGPNGLCVDRRGLFRKKDKARTRAAWQATYRHSFLLIM